MAIQLDNLGPWDWIVLAGVLLGSMLIGVWYGFIKQQKTNIDLLVGGRKIGMLPSTLSLLATNMSAILVLGYTGEVYSNGTLIADMCLTSLIFIPLGGILFLPTLYNLRLTSVYQYLEYRFDSVPVRLLTTATFMLQTILYLGVVLFAPAVALKALIDFPIQYAMLIVGICAAAYTSVGGMKAVVWTDVFQILIMLAGMLAILIKGVLILGGVEKVYETAVEHQRIELINYETDPFIRHTSLSFLLGPGFGWMAAFGCNQMTVQRYCSMSSFKKAFGAMMLVTPLIIFTMGLAVACGVVVFAAYAGCDPLSRGAIERSDQIAPLFVLQYLSSSPGLVGLFVACLFSAALSTLSSGINSLSAVFVEDFLRRSSCFSKMTDISQGYITKLVGLMFGGIAIGTAFVVQNLGEVLQAAIIVNGAVTGPILGVFVMGILLPFTNKHGALWGMLVGHACTMAVSFGALVYNPSKMHTLPLSTDNCTESDWIGFNQTATLERQAEWVLPVEEAEWPLKIFSVSYLLYPFIGCCITVTLGSLISLCTGPSKLTKIQEPYVHPIYVKIKKLLNRGKKPDPEDMMNRSRNAELDVKFSKGVQITPLKQTGHFTPAAYENRSFQT